MKRKWILFFCLLCLFIAPAALASGGGPNLRVGLVAGQFSAEVESEGKIRIAGSGSSQVLQRNRSASITGPTGGACPPSSMRAAGT